ncbi:MAG: tRNA (adenosine(37)-N6)-threonylcarbamoyltransferase complex dimerization subunit type 1 TsaB [Acidimicrobiales bacterium]
MILSIETATTACAAGLADGERRVASLLASDRRHVEVLIPGIQSLLAAWPATLRDVTRIVIDYGPGLFTGLRVGVATARALAEATGAELVGVTSLEIYATQAAARGVTGPVVAVVDGRRGELFAQPFALGDAVVALEAPRVVRPGDLAEHWAAAGEPVTFVGDGAIRYARELAAVPGATCLGVAWPSPVTAIAIGARRGPAPVHPLYLREADAVAHFATRPQP